MIIMYRLRDDEHAETGEVVFYNRGHWALEADSVCRNFESWERLMEYAQALGFNRLENEEVAA